MQKVKSRSKTRQKLKAIEGNQMNIYSEAFELIHQALYACIVRGVIKEDRYRRAEARKEYNVIMSMSHVALENYAIQQLWKLFDKKNSVFNVWHIVENMPHPDLKTWFQGEIEKLKDDIVHLSVCRHNMVGHRSAIYHLTPQEFDKKFSNWFEREERLKTFLIDLLCQMKFEMQRVQTQKTKDELVTDLKNYKRYIISVKEKVLTKYE